ncbi:LysM peptidoglycan-binding domain-containing protein [Arthrobacter tumbae]|uniref:LysM peptidoglycan-binding domain-containing protein n=1 Tax=Arthrobacter tumbae TaxID=163874 RepID=UPI00195D2859|nr:LysM peptidoglycan-binding domain-containing protein [Arthrobacter tumbae]MBM7782760.1 LysM repeat protein [Arthrobacter tumbae]
MSTLHTAGSATKLLPEDRTDSTRGTVSRIHLTRRGWVVLLALPLAVLAAALLIIASFFTSQAQAAETVSGVTDTIRVSVTSGETLWALAAEYAPERDPRAVVEDIVELNALGSSTVQAGQTLHIPVGNP